MGLPKVTLPAMPRRPERGLQRYNNLAHLGIRFHVPVSLGHLVEAVEQPIPTQPRVFEMQGNPAAGEILLMLPGKTFGLKFSEDQSGDDPAQDGN